MGDARGVSGLERLEAIFANEEIHQLAAVVPTPATRQGGRPRHYPAFMAIVYEAAISVFGSARQVEAEFAHPKLWDWIRRLARQHTGGDLPAAPMRRHHYLYLRNRYLTDPAVLDQLSEIHRSAATQQAVGMGLLSSTAGGSWTHPSLDRLLYGDGKVLTPLYRAKPGDTRVDRTTGEIRPLRTETDAALHFEGTGEAAWGTKYVLIATRGPDAHSRMLLDVAPVDTPGGEAASAVACLQRITPLVPHAQGVVYDTALRGTHHQTILRTLGLIPINRVTAAKAGAKRPRRAAADQHRKKLVFIETKTVRRADGTTTAVDLYARAGAVGTGTLTAEGELVFTPLARVRTHRNADKRGYRWYNDYRLPDSLGGGTVTVRLHANASDTARKFNRTENVRPIAPDDLGFVRLFRRRNDAESINRALEDTLWLGRAHSLGHRRQLLNLLGYAIMVNSLALARHSNATPLAA
ncbi:MAG: hypothetical protein M3467_01545 [Actinomycetota bacterium]|nr:hypothetical protein [Actinomycetota bacterium]